MQNADKRIRSQKQYYETVRRNLSKERKRLRKYKGVNLKKWKEYYTISKTRNNKEVQEYVGRSNELTKDIAALHFIEKALPILDSKIEYCKYQLEHGAGFTPQDLAGQLPLAYREQPSYIYELTGAKELFEWLEKNWEFSENYPENKTFRTIAGWKVRSKSEMMIADKLTEARIPYVYEGIRYINGIAFAPDFTLFSQRKKCEIIWEHFGKMSEPDYVVKNLFKLRHYLEDGFLLGDNLILTLEYDNKGFDSKVAERIIDLYC